MFQKGISLGLLVVVLVLAVFVGFGGKTSSDQIDQKSYGFAQDFSWVVGRLEYNPLEGGFWQIRFGDQNDPYDGKFVLGRDPRLNQLKSGDLVKITGRISPEQVSIYMAGTIYEISAIEKISE